MRIKWDPKRVSLLWWKSSLMIKNTWILIPELSLISCSFFFFFFSYVWNYLLYVSPGVAAYTTGDALWTYFLALSLLYTEISGHCFLDEIHVLLSGPWVTSCIHRIWLARISGVVSEGEAEWEEMNHKRPWVRGLDFIKRVRYSSVGPIFSQKQPSALLPV